MKVIILTAGRGTRLLPHTLTKPKQLINVAGKAVLGHIIDRYIGLPVEEYIFVVGYLSEQIEKYVNSNYQIPASFVTQDDPLGQADAILRCRDKVHGPVIVILGDTLTDADFGQLAGETADAVVYLKEVEDPRRFGIAVLDERGMVARFVEKPDSIDNKLAIIGAYYIKDSDLLMECCQELMEHHIRTKGEYYLADALDLMIQKHGAKFRPCSVKVWEDCGKPETLLQTNRYLLDNGHDNSSERPSGNYLVIPPVNIASTATIVNSIIGPHATIADGCTISGSIIRNSIVDEGARIDDTMLDSSLIGKDAIVRGHYVMLNVGDSSQVDFA